MTSTSHTTPGPSPAQRLARSRDALRHSLSTRSGAAQDARPDTGLPWRLDWQSLPGVTMLIRALSLLATPHPLQSVALAASDAGRAALAPALKRHPLGVLAGAFVAGGVLALSRPWRWVWKPSLLAVLLPRVLAIVLSHQSPPLTASTPKRGPSVP